ncbi:MAG: hypothetical protein ACO20H_03785 [Bacteriovoracaceae bacterium]
MKEEKKLLYFLIILIFVYFIQLPLTNSLPGNCDTYLGLAKLNFYTNNIASFFSQSSSSELMGSRFGESVYFIGLPYIILKLLGVNEITSFYFLLVAIYSLTAIALYKLSKLYLKSHILSFCSALFFCFSNFTFGHIDDLHIVFYGLIFYSIYNLKLLHQTGKAKYYTLLLVTSILQIHSSIYNYSVLILSIIIITLINYRNINFGKKKTLKAIGIFGIIHLIFTLQFIGPRLELKEDKDFYNPWNNKAIANIHSFFSLKDFFKKVPGNIYSPNGDIKNAEEELELHAPLIQKGLSEYINPLSKINKKDIRVPAGNSVYYHQLRRSGFIGYLSLIIILVGLIRIKRLEYNWEILAFLIIGITAASGPTFNIGNIPYKTPLFIFYETFDFLSYFRVPTRIYFMALFSLSILYGFGVSQIMSKLKKSSILLPLIFCLIFLIENVPLPLRKSVPPTYPQNLFHKISSGKVLHLPSQIGFMFFDDSKDYFSYSREFIYMNWANFHKLHIANGVNSYFNKPRFELQSAIDQLNIDALKNKYGIKYISIHEHLVIDEIDKTQVNQFKELKELGLIKETQYGKLYKIN